MAIISNIEISQDEFDLFKNYIYRHIGISLNNKKIGLLHLRLNKRLNELNFKSFGEYYNYLQGNSLEHTKFINAISTNVTCFFREEAHWIFLNKHLDSIIKSKKIRIWSSACSSGEEPYSIAMFLKQRLKNFQDSDIKILATDISHNAIDKAQVGVYKQEQVCDMPSLHVSNNFTKIKSTDKLEISKEIKDLVLFRSFNLVYGDYGVFKSTKLDMIFCRNVLIYFDEETKNRVATNLVKQLKSGGYLFIGHSESLMDHEGLRYVTSSIYQKK